MDIITMLVVVCPECKCPLQNIRDLKSHLKEIHNTNTDEISMRIRRLKLCINCGKDTSTIQSSYCSEECRKEPKKQLVRKFVRMCPNCNTEFVTTSPNKQFCSESCKDNLMPKIKKFLKQFNDSVRAHDKTPSATEVKEYFGEELLDETEDKSDDKEESAHVPEKIMMNDDDIELDQRLKKQALEDQKQLLDQ